MIKTCDLHSRVIDFYANWQTGKTREANLKHLIFMYYVFLIRDFYYTIRVV